MPPSGVFDGAAIGARERFIRRREQLPLLLVDRAARSRDHGATTTAASRILPDRAIPARREAPPCRRSIAPFDRRAILER
jgi:hypothetical protein